MSVPPTAPPPEASVGEGLIIWRLNELSQQLQKLVTRETYELKHAALVARVSALEALEAQRDRDRRNLTLALVTSSLSPLVAVALFVVTMLTR